MLRRILDALSIASLLVGLIVFVFWWHSYKHIDHFSYGAISSRRTEFTSSGGRVMVTVSQNFPGDISTRTEFHPYSQIAGGCLAIPAFWLAIWLRSKLLPRPGALMR